MTDPYSISAIVFGLIGIVSLLIRCAVEPKKRKPLLANGVVMFISAAAIPGGFKVCMLVFDSSLDLPDNDKLYIFVGGLAVIWVSIDTMWTTLTDE